LLSPPVLFFIRVSASALPTSFQGRRKRKGLQVVPVLRACGEVRESDVLFGHPSGGPFSHNAALAHFEAQRLEAFCVAWMPSLLTLQLLDSISPLRPMARRLRCRRFPALAGAPKIQGRLREMRRLITRAIGRGDEAVADEANDWLGGKRFRKAPSQMNKNNPR
jgi:hypothetical protein